MSTVPDLGQAITDYVDAKNAYNTAVATSSASHVAVDNAQSALDTVQSQAASDDQAKADAATALNTALDNLSAAAEAAKVPPNTQQTPPAPHL